MLSMREESATHAGRGVNTARSPPYSIREQRARWRAARVVESVVASEAESTLKGTRAVSQEPSGAALATHVPGKGVRGGWGCWGE